MCRAEHIWVHLHGCFASGSGTPQAVLLQGTGGWLFSSPQAPTKYEKQEACLKV